MKVDILEELSDLTAADLCRASLRHAEWLEEVIAEGIISPPAEADRGRCFTGQQLRRVCIVSHLQRDLGVNLAGAALALDLLDEIAVLRSRLAVFDSDGS